MSDLATVACAIEGLKIALKDAGLSGEFSLSISKEDLRLLQSHKDAAAAGLTAQPGTHLMSIR